MLSRRALDRELWWSWLVFLQRCLCQHCPRWPLNTTENCVSTMPASAPNASVGRSANRQQPRQHLLPCCSAKPCSRVSFEKVSQSASARLQQLRTALAMAMSLGGRVGDVSQRNLRRADRKRPHPGQTTAVAQGQGRADQDKALMNCARRQGQRRNRTIRQRSQRLRHKSGSRRSRATFSASIAGVVAVSTAAQHHQRAEVSALDFRRQRQVRRRLCPSLALLVVFALCLAL